MLVCVCECIYINVCVYIYAKLCMPTLESVYIYIYEYL